MTENSWKIFRKQKGQAKLFVKTALVVLSVGGFALYTLVHDAQVVAAHEAIHGRYLEGGCPEPAKPAWHAWGYFFGVLYLFVGLAIIADDFFCPALDVIADQLDLSPDVAGATLMAAGGSAPELFANLMGTFLRSDVGFGTIVGSAVFNVLFVVGVCSIVTTVPMQLTWWPLIRDSTCYSITLLVLAYFFGVSSPQLIEKWEALCLFILYWCYVLMMGYNQRIYEWVSGGVPMSDEHKQTDYSSERDDDVELHLRDMSMRNTGAPITFKISTKGASTRGSFLALPGQEDLSSFSGERRELWLRNRLSWLRAGVYKMLISKPSLLEKAGAAMVMRMSGTAEQVFMAFDKDGNGRIDQSELREVFKTLGCEMNDEASFQEAWKQLVTTSGKTSGDSGKGEITLTAFKQWFVVSDARLRSEVKDVFTRIDTNRDGRIDEDELLVLLKTINPHITPHEIHASLLEFHAHGGSISYDEFSSWYESTLFWNPQAAKTPQHSRSESLNSKSDLVGGDGEEDEEENDEEGISIYPPEDGSLYDWVWYLVTIPMVFMFVVTIADVKKKDAPKFYAYFAFVTCLAWMGLLSFYMVKGVETIGATLGVPDVIMGLTFLAAGTSVPDMLAAVIVAKQGQGDKAVSSSIGSNVFDICIGLALPWLLFNIVYEIPVKVIAEGFEVSIFILFFTLCVMIYAIRARDWALPASTGWFFIALYFVYVLQQVARSKFGTCGEV